jgi:hypothetical protein
MFFSASGFPRFPFLLREIVAKLENGPRFQKNSFPGLVCDFFFRCCAHPRPTGFVASHPKKKRFLLHLFAF